MAVPSRKAMAFPVILFNCIIELSLLNHFSWSQFLCNSVNWTSWTSTGEAGVIRIYYDEEHMRDIRAAFKRSSAWSRSNHFPMDG